MNREIIFNRSIRILVTAFYKGNLTHEGALNCTAHLLAIPNNYTVSYMLMHPLAPINSTYTYSDLFKNKGFINSSGYSFEELKEIERIDDSFSHQDDPTGYNGVKAVVDYLFKIHEIEDGHYTSSKTAFMNNVRENPFL